MVMTGRTSSRSRGVLHGPAAVLLSGMGRLLTSSLVLTVETIEALLAAVLGSREKTLYEVDVQCTVPGNSQVDIMALADQVSEAMAASAESVQCGGSQKERTLR